MPNMNAAILFDQLVRILTYAGVPFQAFEDHSIRLLGPAAPSITRLIDLLHTING